MAQSQDKRTIAALKAIIQTMLPEYYLMQSGGSPKDNFLESLEMDEPIAMAISNEFTESEIETRRADGSVLAQARVLRAR